MLIIKSNDPQQKRRHTSGEVYQRLEGMRQKCQQSTYALTPAPWAYTPVPPENDEEPIARRIQTWESESTEIITAHPEAIDMYRGGSDQHEGRQNDKEVVDSDMTTPEVADPNTTRVFSEATNMNEEMRDNPQSPENGEEAPNDKMTILEVGPSDAAGPPSGARDMNEDAENKTGCAWLIRKALKCLNVCNRT